MNPGNYREALIETRADEREGADILMVIFDIPTSQSDHCMMMYGCGEECCFGVLSFTL